MKTLDKTIFEYSLEYPSATDYGWACDDILDNIQII